MVFSFTELDTEPEHSSSGLSRQGATALLVLFLSIDGIGLTEVGAQSVGMPIASTTSSTLSHWFSLIFFIVLSAFFSGSETALFSLSKVERLSLDRSGDPINRMVSHLWSRRERVLNTLLLGNNFANIGTAISGGALTAYYFSESETLAFLFGAIGVTGILIFFGEVIPKSVSVQWGRLVANFCAFPLLLFYYLIWPFQFIVTSIASIIMFMFRIIPHSLDEFVSDEEMRVMVIHGVQDPSVEEREIEMIGGVLEFSESTVDEIMTPRTEVQAYPIETPHKELVEALRSSRHSRVLIYKDSLDEVKGALHVKDLLLNPETSLEELVREPLLVPPKKDLYELMKEFCAAHTHIAIVVDEFGGVAGIVTLNDLLEEIFGKIEEVEEDRETLIIPEGENTYRIRGSIEMEELNKHFNTMLSVDQGRTLSGYLFNVLGHIPKPGEHVTDDWGEYEILEVERRRVVWVRWEKTEVKIDEELKT